MITNPTLMGHQLLKLLNYINEEYEIEALHFVRKTFYRNPKQILLKTGRVVLHRG